jgi:hypothetical protein
VLNRVRRAAEGSDRDAGERDGEQDDDGEAEPGLGGRVAHAPDVVEPGPVGIDEAVAHQRHCVGEREHLGEGGQRAGQRADREEGAGEEPRQDRDGGRRADVLLLPVDAGGEGLGDAVHQDDEQHGRGHEPGEAGGSDVEVGSARGGRDGDHDDL